MSMKWTGMSPLEYGPSIFDLTVPHGMASKACMHRPCKKNCGAETFHYLIDHSVTIFHTNENAECLIKNKTHTKGKITFSNGEPTCGCLHTCGPLRATPHSLRCTSILLHQLTTSFATRTGHGNGLLRES